ncbi:MAG: response regulator [Candidatus Omnitrophica bacterium]|nr:response regulator [Candidatus Omnitrophota bacterium]
MEIKKKILIVDDEVDFLEVMKLRLMANNYQVITASTGEEALQKFSRENPSALLLDIMMPGMDGLTILEKIREIDKLIPVFIITAFTNEERFRSANRLNASGFILKTDNLKEQVANITEAIKLAEKYKE